ncbi:GDP-L-fucose synthase [Roseovarius faecimaris]|uniref:GDP-L-fucose synthase n=1 Tax=Roseovarius faecimaris TaxID=2494550 RepID=A0A6I6IM19_9RHOB|nr:GDP-L-fucose synthase [Roseovarius faecimaris]QGX96911.1 GDP-L-fucose synthase [Roseovarius faecimaris]
MKVFLTGGRGMVGRAVQDDPAAAGHEIIAPSSVELDLTDRAAVIASVAEAKPDLVIHAAGRVGGIQANMANKAGFLTDNMDMGLNIVLAAKAAGVPRLLNLGSSCMYPHDAPNPLAEESLGKGELEPTNEGYGLAKLAVARLCAFVSDENEALSYKTLMPCNLYGLHDKFDPARSHLVPAIIRKVHEAKLSGAASVEIWGDGTARREFMFAGDLADAIWTAAARFDELPGFMNVGLGEDRSINDYYAEAARVIGWEGTFTHDLTKPTGMKQKLVSVDRAKSFGWCARTSLADGLALTYEHFKEHHA